MSSPAEQRKLAAIMFTDMVGYSALSQRDEKLAQELLEEHRQLLREIFPRFNGTEIKTIGDGFLVEFNSALEAAQCAIEIQRALAKRNADISPDRRIELKIGIHIGDVVHRGGDVYGDGVNIASRIEPLAGAGGICVSMDVERQIRNAVETRFEKLAPMELKNISVPMELFRIVLPWERKTEVREQKSELRKGATIPKVGMSVLIGAVGLLLIGGTSWWFTHRANYTTSTPRQDASPARTEAATTSSNAKAPIPEKSIAVLPFENLSDDKQNGYFTDGVQEEILSDLAKVADLKVISRTSVMQYKTGVARNLREIGQQLGVAHLLEGSVQRAGNKVRVNAQLIDARTDGHLWAQVFDRPLDDVFAIQSEIAQAIADQLQAKLSPKETAAMQEKPTTDLAAYDLYLRAKEIWQSNGSSGVETFQREVALLEEAVMRDPAFVAAFCLLAQVHVQFYWFNYDHSAARLELAKKALDAAARLSPDGGEVHLARAIFYYRGQRDYAAALKELALARHSLPNDSSIPLLTGLIERRQGHFTESNTYLEQALAIDPHNNLIIIELVNGYTWTGHYAEGRRLLDEALSREPNNFVIATRRARIDYWESGDLHRMQQLSSKDITSGTDPSDLVKFRLAHAWWQRNFPAAQRALAEYPLPDVATSGFLVPRQAWEGVLWKRLGETGKAQSALDQARERAAAAVAARPDDAKALSVLADMDADLGRKEEAIREGERSVELMPVEKDAVDAALLQNALALIYAKTGENARALDLLEKLTKKPFGPDYGTLLAPDWDPIRAETRFQKIVAGLAPKDVSTPSK
jgi:TolB-like protein/class 3 adenylate cyclase